MIVIEVAVVTVVMVVVMVVVAVVIVEIVVVVVVVVALPTTGDPSNTLRIQSWLKEAVVRPFAYQLGVTDRLTDFSE